MINWVKPAGQSPPGGFSAASQSLDWETVPEKSFGEILKAKETREQREIQESVSSAAAALAGVMTFSSAKLFTVADDGSNSNNTPGKYDQRVEGLTSPAVSSTLDRLQTQTGLKYEDGDNTLGAAVQADEATSSPGYAEGALPEGQISNNVQNPVVAQEDGNASETPFQALPFSADTQPIQASVVQSDKTAGLKAGEPEDSIHTASSPVDSGLKVEQGLQNLSANTEQETTAQAVAIGDVAEPASVLSQAPGSTIVRSEALPTPVLAFARQVEMETSQTETTLGEMTIPLENVQGADPLTGITSTLSTAPANSVVDNVAAAKLSVQAAVNVSPADVTQQIMRQMSVTMQSGPTSMRLQLHPLELGVIDIQMIKNAQGVSVTFFAEQAGTGRLLESQMDQLRQALTDSGIQLTNLNVGQQGQQGSSFRQASQFAYNANHGAEQVEKETQVDNKPQAALRVNGQLQGVDYRI